MWSGIVFWISIFAILNPIVAENTLRFVNAIWRHGDRAPSDGPFPTDTENGDETWSQGIGELTQAGMRQHQTLGRYLRQRYVVDMEFLSANYSAREIYIRSTSYNRTIMSALSNMAGMYPVQPDMLDGITLWQPIPIHSQPREKDPMLWMDCPCQKAVDIYFNEIMTTEEVKKIDLENKDFFEFLRNNTGYKKVTLDDTWDIWDPLNCERIYSPPNGNHHWPDWVNETIFDKLTELMTLSTKYYYHDPKLQRFRGRLLFNDIATRLQQKATNSTLMKKELKYFVYSAHDTTMMALLDNLGAYQDNAHLPEYASAILFELHETDGKFTVQTWYVNMSSPRIGMDHPVRVKVAGCDTDTQDCPLETFVKIAGTNVPPSIEAWLEECENTPITPTTSTVVPVTQPNCDSAKQPATIAAIVLGVTTGVFFLLFLITLFCFCRLKQRNKVGY